ncbi:MAG TPA: HAD family hydrolase [Stellaceae bacterium]|nr:HAD family hydrolase [Stellaceae bacterium]
MAGAPGPGWDLVIFDCDGVLIDSELLTIDVEVALLAEAGIAITADEIIERYVGISTTAMITDLEARFGRSLDDFATRHAARVRDVFDRRLRAMPGVAEVLAALPARVCVASSSSPERLRHTLGVTGLYRHFEPHIFSATMVTRGKPAPDLFLYAAERMGAAPSHSIVIEDSLPGIEAAAAAGMTAIGFTGGSHCREDHAARLSAGGAAVVVQTMSQILPAIAELSRRLR